MPQNPARRNQPTTEPKINARKNNIKRGMQSYLSY